MINNAISWLAERKLFHNKKLKIFFHMILWSYFLPTNCLQLIDLVLLSKSAEGGNAWWMLLDIRSDTMFCPSTCFQHAVQVFHSVEASPTRRVLERKLWKQACFDWRSHSPFHSLFFSPIIPHLMTTVKASGHKKQ